MKSGLFISLEGGEGTGKSTQVALLAENLRQLGHTVCVTREPGGCPIADQIRCILLNPENRATTSTTELLLYAAARSQHVEEVIRPALLEGCIVICDRFTDSTRAYQGTARGLDVNTIETLNKIATTDLEPHLTILLDMPPEKALKRAMRRNSTTNGPDEGRFEQEALDFHQGVKRGFDSLAEMYPARIRTVNAAGTPDTVARRIWQMTISFLANQ